MNFGLVITLVCQALKCCKFQCVRIRKMHKINVQELREDFLHLDLINCPNKTASLLSYQYFTALHNLLDKNSPVKNKKDIPKHPFTGLIMLTSLPPNVSRGSVIEHGGSKLSQKLK